LEKENEYDNETNVLLFCRSEKGKTVTR